MREILFRGKREDNGVEVVGYFLKLNGEEPLHIIVDQEGQYHKVDPASVVADNNVWNKWIPVTERLPETIPCNAGTAYSEAVIVWTNGRKAMVSVWDGVDFLCAADYWEAWGEDITHWMPLPQPPKGVDNAEKEESAP